LTGLSPREPKWTPARVQYVKFDRAFIRLKIVELLYFLLWSANRPDAVASIEDLKSLINESIDDFVELHNKMNNQADKRQLDAVLTAKDVYAQFKASLLDSPP
jgi:hypothetical protein